MALLFFIFVVACKPSSFIGSYARPLYKVCMERINKVARAY